MDGARTGLGRVLHVSEGRQSFVSNGIINRRENALTTSKGTHMATFHAPPWCPAAMIFFRLMMTGAALDCVPIFTTFKLTQDQG